MRAGDRLPAFELPADTTGDGGGGGGGGTPRPLYPYAHGWMLLLCEGFPHETVELAHNVPGVAILSADGLRALGARVRAVAGGVVATVAVLPADHPAAKALGVQVHYITLHYITLYYSILYYSITLQYYVILHCITLHYIAWCYGMLRYVTLHYGVRRSAVGVQAQCLFLVRPDSHVALRSEPARGGAVLRYLETAIGAALPEAAPLPPCPPSSPTFDRLPAALWSFAGALAIAACWSTTRKRL